MGSKNRTKIGPKSGYPEKGPKTGISNFHPKHGSNPGFSWNSLELGVWENRDRYFSELVLVCIGKSILTEIVKFDGSKKTKKT